MFFKLGVFDKCLVCFFLFQVEQDIPAKRSRIDCNSDSGLITSTPQTRGPANKSTSRVCRKSANKGTVIPVWNISADRSVTDYCVACLTGYVYRASFQSTQISLSLFVNLCPHFLDACGIMIKLNAPRDTHWQSQIFIYDVTGDELE